MVILYSKRTGLVRTIDVAESVYAGMTWIKDVIIVIPGSIFFINGALIPNVNVG
jgi:hypothetical protein